MSANCNCWVSLASKWLLGLSSSITRFQEKQRRPAHLWDENVQNPLWQKTFLIIFWGNIISSISLCSHRIFEGVSLFSFCGASMWMCFLCDFSTDIQFLSISSWAELPVFGPNNSGEFLSYRIISCLSSKTASHHSVRSKKLEIHHYPKQGIKARAKAERSLKDSPTFWFII